MGDSEEEQKMEGINEVRDSDVLCGRGGAALRHAGNQTYRKLVSLNKGLYITCLKTEKLKISRSIVAAIREKKGRFLEKDAATGTWYDIGDKKAVEKTSQALREGQPKLRQQIVDLGGGAVGAASLIESQFGPQAAAAVAGAGLYPTDPRNSLMNSSPSMAMGNGTMSQAMIAAGGQQGYHGMHHHQQQQHQQQMNGMPFDDVQNDLMQRLSLHDTSVSGHDSNHMQQQQQMQNNNMRPPMNIRGGMMGTNGMGLSVGDSQASQMTDFSAFASGQSGHTMNHLHSMNCGPNLGIPMDPSFQAALQSVTSPPGSIASSMHSTQHTLDFYSMHSIDTMNGISNHSMGVPSSHRPTMSSMVRQQQIDERYPLQQQSIGINPAMMNQSFRGQTHDTRTPQPPQPQQQQQQMQQKQQKQQQPMQQKQEMQQHIQQQIQQQIQLQAPTEQHPGQLRLHALAQKSNPSDYNNSGMGMPKVGEEDDLEPVHGFPDQARSGYSNKRQQQQYSDRQGRPSQQGSHMEDGNGCYSEDQIRGVARAVGSGGASYYDGPTHPGRAASAGRGGGGGYDEQAHDDDVRLMGPPTASSRNIAANYTATSTQPSVLGAANRQKTDRRNLFARMKYTRPPSYRDSKRTMGGASTHSQLSIGDGMPDIHMVESQLSLHSTLSAMTDGNSTNHNHNNNKSGKGSWVERAPVVDHSARSEGMDVLTTGSKHSLMSGLSRISDYSATDASIFSHLSKAIGNVSTRSIAMSEISVIDVAEQDGEDEPSSNHEEATESQE